MTTHFSKQNPISNYRTFVLIKQMFFAFVGLDGKGQRKKATPKA